MITNKKIIKIEVTGNYHNIGDQFNIILNYDDNTKDVLLYKIRLSSSSAHYYAVLKSHDNNNDYIFELLGITNPRHYLKSLGINVHIGYWPKTETIDEFYKIIKVISYYLEL